LDLRDPPKILLQKIIPQTAFANFVGERAESLFILMEYENKKASNIKIFKDFFIE
jgi:hypothetical protein